MTRNVVENEPADHIQVYLSGLIFQGCPDDFQVICLQEVDECYFDSFYCVELKKYGYSGHFVKRTGIND